MNDTATRVILDAHRARAAAVDAATLVEDVTGVRMPRLDEAQISTLTDQKLGRAVRALTARDHLTDVQVCVVGSARAALCAARAAKAYRKSGADGDAWRVADLADAAQTAAYRARG